MQTIVAAVALPADLLAPGVLELVDAVMVANARARASEPDLLYCAIARCASCYTEHAAPTTGVMFDRCGCGGYLFAIVDAASDSEDLCF